MIIWHEELYIEEKIKKHKKLYISKINKEKFIVSVYCITLASNPENLLDIISASELKWHHYKRNNIVIIGLCGSREGAMELVADIVNEVYNKTGNFNIREYLGYS